MYNCVSNIQSCILANDENILNIHTEVAETVSRKTATATTIPNTAIMTDLRSRLFVDEAFIVDPPSSPITPEQCADWNLTFLTIA